MADDAIHVARTEPTQMHTDKQYRDMARELYVEDGYIEIDDTAVISAPGDGGVGVYIQAWVYVANTDVAVESGPESEGNDGDLADEAYITTAVAA